MILPLEAIIRRVAIAFLLLALPYSAEAACSGQTLGQYKNEDCGYRERQWSAPVFKRYPPIFGARREVADAFYESRYREFRVGPSFKAKEGDNDPECASPVQVIGIPLTRPSACASFCYENASQDQGYEVYFWVYEDNRRFLGGGEAGFHKMDWASTRRTGFACVEFRNWSEDRTRRITVELRKLLRQVPRRGNF